MKMVWIRYVEPKYNEIVGVHLYCIHATDMASEACWP
jgi:hypothetical protein